jgi:hypothetical protein
MRALGVLVVVLGGCDPYWGVAMRLRDPANGPVAGATVAVACKDDGGMYPIGWMRRSDAAGTARVGSLGSQWPVGCDIYVAKPGYQTHWIRYRDLCPNGPDHCDRMFDFDLTIVRDQTWISASRP